MSAPENRAIALSGAKKKPDALAKPQEFLEIFWVVSHEVV